MNSKILVIAIAGLLVLAAGITLLLRGPSEEQPANTSLPAGANADNAQDNQTPAPATQQSPAALIIAKEFSMTSYFEMANGQPSAHFSLKEINVKKGDRVRIKVTNTRGTHDFSLDEYGIKKETPLNEEVIIEFTADKGGEFVYYCSMPNHRAMGQWGTLRVTE